MKTKQDVPNRSIRAFFITALLLVLPDASYSFSLRSAISHRRNQLSTHQLFASSSPKRVPLVNHKCSTRRGTTALSMASSASSLGISRVISSLHADDSFILSVVAVVSAFGIAMEQKTTLGKALSVSARTVCSYFCF